MPIYTPRSFPALAARTYSSAQQRSSFFVILRFLFVEQICVEFGRVISLARKVAFRGDLHCAHRSAQATARVRCPRPLRLRPGQLLLPSLGRTLKNSHSRVHDKLRLLPQKAPPCVGEGPTPKARLAAPRLARPLPCALQSQSRMPLSNCRKSVCKRWSPRMGFVGRG